MENIGSCHFCSWQTPAEETNEGKLFSLKKIVCLIFPLTYLCQILCTPAWQPFLWHLKGRQNWCEYSQMLFSKSKTQDAKKIQKPKYIRTLWFPMTKLCKYFHNVKNPLNISASKRPWILRLRNLFHKGKFRQGLNSGWCWALSPCLTKHICKCRISSMSIITLPN